jgi:tRNA threonylcarbamoyladenosine biosynthesis protein TsaE
MHLLEIATASAAETEALGARLGQLLRETPSLRGSGIAVSGELGAGKTVLIRGLARGLGVDEPDEVRSPTYLMMIEHPGPVPLFHVDAYFSAKGARLEEEGALAEAGERGITAVEWPERLPSPCPEGWLRVHIEFRSLSGRALQLRGKGPDWERLLSALPPEPENEAQKGEKGV